MEFVPDCLQRMANRPAQLLVALSRRSKIKWNAAFLCACCRR